MVDTRTTPAEAPAGGPLTRHWQKLLAAAIWLALAGSFLGYSLATGSTPTATLQAVVDLLRTPWGPLLYILLNAVRPLAFFSTIVISMLAGAIWGPVLGVLYVVIGSNLSASVAYTFARALGKGALPEGDDAVGGGRIGRYAERLRANTFTTVLLMRLLYLPYDLVNYLAGFLRAPFVQFIVATAVGSLPGTLTFVLAGASLDIDDIFAGNFSVSALNPWTLALSAAMFVAGLAISRLLRRREGGA